ncbi:MAG TPA: sulfotransferase domain-containing protein [Bryobacteraceae bacterium]|jgi:hypothetical protein
MDSKKPFVRKPPPLPARIAMGVLMDGFAGPFINIMAKVGRAEKVFAGMGKRRRKQIAERNPFAGYVPTERDVFIAVFPKSGTNWTMQIAHQLLNNGRGEFGHIHELVPWPDTRDMGPMSRYAVPLEDESAWRASPAGKRVIKTHFAWEDLPYSPDARYIIVVRDPKDVFVSSYHFFGNIIPIRSLDLWIKLFCSDAMFWGNWAHSTAGYWAQRHRPNVLVLSFKSMKRDLPGNVRKIADFLNVNADEAVLQRVIERSSFEYMKSVEEKFEMWHMIPWRSRSPMLRKGSQGGGGAELLSPEQRQQMDAYFMGELKRLGSDFPYEEFCDIARPADRIERAGAA